MIRRILKQFKIDRALIQNFRQIKFKRDYPNDHPRIFILVNSLGGAGAQRVASILATGLNETYNVSVITFYPRAVEYTVSEQIEWIELADRTMVRIMQLFLLRWFRHPAAVISFLYDGNQLNLSSKGHGKVICSERNNPIKKAPLRFNKTVKQYRKADHVVFQSESVKQLYPKEIQDHSSILPNPVTVAVNASEKPNNRIVTVGRLHEQKNQAMLIRAFAKFHTTHPDYELSLYGDGPLKEKLMELACQLGINDSVFFHGNVRNIHSLIADAKMFVLPSDYEGLSNALLEALMMGLPCISTDCEGSIDVIQSEENGLLVPIGNESALYHAMCRIADDDAFCESIRRAGKKTGEKFRIENVIPEWEAMIEKVIAE